MSAFELFSMGVFGGVVAEFLKIWPLQKVPAEFRPQWLKSWFFWLLSAVRVLIGGCVVLMYVWSSDVKLTAFLAFHIGASLPLIISTLTSKAPAISPGSTD
jgi:hypothetical protein